MNPQKDHKIPKKTQEQIHELKNNPYKIWLKILLRDRYWKDIKQW